MRFVKFYPYVDVGKLARKQKRIDILDELKQILWEDINLYEEWNRQIDAALNKILVGSKQ